MLPRRLFSLKTACALWSLWFITHPAVAEYRFDVWTADLGLPQNSIGRILQSRDGYIWLTTLDGLVRFDGLRFTVFDKGNSPGLPGNRITALYEDRNGDLWVGTEDVGLARYHRGRFTAFTAQDGLPAGVIASISGDAQGHLWVRVGDVLLQWKEGRFVPGLPERAAALFDPKVTRYNAEGLLWTTNQNALHLFSRGQLTTLSRSNGLPSLRVNNVDEDRHGTVWVATADAGLVKVRDGNVIKVYTQQDGLPSNRLIKPGASTFSGTWTCEDRKGNLWLVGAGPWLGRLKDGVFTSYPNSNTLSSHPLPSAPSSRGGPITALFEDREGNLWIGTDGSGLIRAREQVVNVFSTRHGLHAANIYPICEDRAGAVWLGAWDKGLIRIRDGVVSNFGLKSRNWIVTGLLADRDQQLWVASLGGGVGIFQNGALTSVGVPPELRGKTVHAMYQDRAGVLWFDGERGLSRFRNGELSSFTDQEGRALAPAKVIIEDRAGALWIGTYGGLMRLENGRFTTWTERDGLPSNSVRALYEDRDGTLWIGTYDGGLGRFKDGRFTRYTVKEGLFNNGVFQILEDARGNFWMSSNRGIHRASKKELNEFAEGRRRTITSISYGKSDGMLNVECNGGASPSGVKTRDGKLWFPTQDGVAVIDPDAISSNPTPPPAVIESFLLDREPQTLDRPLRIPPGKANIEIQYTGLSFINSERLLFKYRLEGADDEWVEAGTRRTAYYSHLAPGQYTFTVLAANSDGLWNETGASLAFTVLPAWHQTAWFRALAVAAVCSAGLGFYRLRITRLEAQRAAQQEFSRRLIESQEQERQRLAAELHDSLGQNLLVIKNRAVMALDHSDEPPKMCEQITQVSEMASQAIREVRAIAQDLRPFQLDEMGLTKAITAMTRRLADSSKIQFHLDVTDLEGVFPRESEIHFYRIVQECLTNILKHSGATQASITISKQGAGLLRTLIQDNGRGFGLLPQADQPAPTGFGLRGIRERARTLGGRVEFDSRPGEGTTVVIEVPIHPRENSHQNHHC